MKTTGPNPPSLLSAPAWGVGIGYRFCIHREVMQSEADLDFLEIPAEDYVDANRRKYADPGEVLLKDVVRHFPVVGHGSDVSIGSSEPPPADYLARVAAFVQRIPVTEYSEHLTCTRAGNENVTQFIAIPFTDLGVAATVANARRVARRVGLPFLLENVCYHFPIPGSSMREEDFITKVVTAVDCGVLLDITNVFINASNHNYDPHGFIRSLPAERILQAHYCGVFRRDDGYLLDTHSEITPKEVWNLVDYTLANTSLRALILERDDKFLPWEATINEIRLAKEIFLKHRPAKMPSGVRTASPFVPSPTETDLDEGGYSKELALFQQVLFAMLLDEELAEAVSREGESALRHTGLGKDERLVLASIPASRRNYVGAAIRAQRHRARLEHSKRVKSELARWARIGG